MKICEINARFVLNAYLITYFGYNLINECAEMKKVVEKNKDFDLESIKEIGAIDRIYEQVFDTSKSIGILKFKEVSVFMLFFLFLKELYKYINFLSMGMIYIFFNKSIQKQY